MSGDPANTNDDELVDQIDELKARMDRLMRGGSSTSNSALLTDAAKQKPAEPVQDEVAPPASRTRVRDLIEPEDSEIVETYPGPKEVVPFPADADHPAQEQQPVAPPVAVSEPKPEKPATPRSSPVEGSLISVDGGSPEPRPVASSFDDLGNAVQQEIARDASVPPIETKKGPDLASRFGARDDARVAPAEEVIEDEPVEKVEDYEEIEEYEDEVVAEYEDVSAVTRNPGGLVAAIWVFTALVSGAIATLHFTGGF